MKFLIKGSRGNYRNISIFVFIIAVFLRLVLACVNFQANDNQLRVAQIIYEEDRLPIKEDCYQCFQPKFYHLTVAFLFRIFAINDYTSQLRLAQLVSAVCGVIFLIFVYSFLKLYDFENSLRFTAFTLIALNPKLIGINAQATNDSFSILFSSMTIYFTVRYFRAYRWIDYLSMTIFCICAGFAKGSGMILFPIILFVFIVKMFIHRSNPRFHFPLKRWAISVFIFVALWMATVPIIGQYWQHYYRYGSAIGIYYKKQPLPPFFKNELVMRPGVTSIWNSYFTFRFIDLMKNPHITNGQEVIPWHRTSFWTQIYGRAHFAQFDSWPTSWRTSDPKILNLGRMIFVLALIPTCFLIWGFIREIFISFQSLLRKNFVYFLEEDGWIYCLFVAAGTLSIVYFSLQYRDFSSMKAIYIYPMLLAFLYLFCNGGRQIVLNLQQRWPASCQIMKLFYVLFVLYVIDIIFLIQQILMLYVHLN